MAAKTRAAVDTPYVAHFKHGNIRRFEKHEQALKWAQDQFLGQRKWAQKFNQRMLVEIESAVSELEAAKARTWKAGDSVRLTRIIDDVSGVPVELTIVKEW